MTARLMIIAGGPSAPFPPLHAGIQMARGIRDWFRANPGLSFAAVVHLVDPGVWFNIQSGRLNLAELCRNHTVQAVVMVQKPGRVSESAISVGRPVGYAGGSGRDRPCPVAGMGCIRLTRSPVR